MWFKTICEEKLINLMNERSDSLFEVKDSYWEPKKSILLETVLIVSSIDSEFEYSGEVDSMSVMLSLIIVSSSQ